MYTQYMHVLCDRCFIAMHHRVFFHLGIMSPALIQNVYVKVCLVAENYM